MNDDAESTKERDLRSELDLPQWSVVSFDTCEASELTYEQAEKLMAEKDAAGVYGLCIITDQAAQRIGTSR